ncbi:50S ribosomal protein L4 [endosymbiont of Euscepes postfasciatus]|uniref:50S ribosomal protein L4 n=1 Tax=endosymbiont of Euscepes postfasciatus TaxID=650377 RepID=UPI000DC72B3E|nr:50S ribosomal protein L4 [endosymbiont of Euscepes postfasciatus]BBA84692.1 50S ribosomal protein L4 [endosymbiont of Euscepes postfasciatus]
MKIILKDTKKEIDILDNIFNVKYNESVIHQVYVSYLSNIRQNTKLNKNRSNVSGSNKKPWKQKGTGKARSGCIRSPIWRSGGVTFGNQRKNYVCKINKKMYKLACKSMFSKFININSFIVFNEFYVNSIKTKYLYNKIFNIVKKNKTVILIDKYNEYLIKSSNNIYFLYVKCIFDINLISLLNFNYIILTEFTLRNLEKLLL